MNVRIEARRWLPTILLALIGAACDNGNASAEGPAREVPAPVTEPSGDPVKAALANYESVRATLAKDGIAAITPPTAALHMAAQLAAEAAPEEARPRWLALAAAARRLQQMKKQDADAVRKAFGEVSRALIALLASDAALAQGRHAFQCPMAQGYQKWVQLDPETVDNPYMGSKMLRCGSKSDFE